MNRYVTRMKIDAALLPLRQDVEAVCRRWDAGELPLADIASLGTALRLIRSDQPSLSDIAAASAIIAVIAGSR